MPILTAAVGQNLAACAAESNPESMFCVLFTAPTARQANMWSTLALRRHAAFAWHVARLAEGMLVKMVH